MSQTKTQDMKTKNTITGARGITFAGEEFVVPETHDVLETLFDPFVRKSYFEIVILLVLASNGVVFWLCEDYRTRTNIFIGLYVFWRLSYNFGIGYLLNRQSNYNKLVGWSKSLGVFEGNNSSLLSRVIKAEVKSQMGDEYSIKEYPIEFNTWLIFRKVVDLILMSDFVTFMFLVVTRALDKDFQFFHGQSAWLVYLRLSVGASLVVFNWWVKVNAHLTIKDYAWYWGDFFFRQINNEELIFDGVFEMFPHPMYSVGYIGYYGFALISKSYTVLVVALFGHFLQMIFLHFIENPHIDKIYGPSSNEQDLQKLLKLKDLNYFDNSKPLVGLVNFNYIRASDFTTLVLVITWSTVVPLIASLARKQTPSLDWIMFGLTISTKLFESIIINSLLILQSYYNIFTKWYLSNDNSVEKSLNNWSILYNTLISLAYSSFFGLNLYDFFTDRLSSHFYEWFYLRCFLGACLIITQVWINCSIIESIGYFGWFYGDFFIPRRSNLTKAGVYRYLNNPEQIFGVCGVMGVTLINPSFENILCCLLWVGNNFFRINFIEKVHMIRVYGEQEVLKDSGVTKTLKKHLIPDSIKRRMSETDRKRRNSLSESLDSFIRELRKSNTNLSKQNMLELSQNIHFDNSDYKIEIETKHIKLGEPIVVRCISPADHSKKDWIGLYKVTQTSYSRFKTLISSSGRWVWCDSEDETYVFQGDRLFWEEGVYEFRYHLHGKHDVVYISEPFEIEPDHIQITSDTSALANELKAKIFDRVIQLNDIDQPIPEVVTKSENILNTYYRLSSLISVSTGIKIQSKVFLNEELTITKLSSKLINIKNVLDNLSPENNSIDGHKKND